jgi:alpha-D-ribose 1-methylphosphonate 5-triphosphate synthase subunit PhnL
VSEPVLAVRGLTKRFTLHERATTIEPFVDLSFDVLAGELLIFLGASGAGKSSVLRSLYRSYVPTAGVAHYRRSDGTTVDLCSAAEQTILKLRRQEIRFVSQFLSVLPRRGAAEVVAQPLLELGRPTDDSRAAARAMLSRIGLPERLWHVPPATFSGGERQLVNLARALIVAPRLLLIDEPTASLDPQSTERIVAVIEQLRRQQIAILAVFHDRRIVERLADKTITMAGGVSWEHEPAAGGAA